MAAVKRAKGAAAKAARLANHVRSAAFMERLQSDLATRESRLKELQRHWRVGRGEGGLAFCLLS